MLAYEYSATQNLIMYISHATNTVNWKSTIDCSGYDCTPSSKMSLKVAEELGRYYVAVILKNQPMFIIGDVTDGSSVIANQCSSDTSLSYTDVYLIRYSLIFYIFLHSSTKDFIFSYDPSTDSYGETFSSTTGLKVKTLMYSSSMYTLGGAAFYKKFSTLNYDIGKLSTQ